MSVLSGLDNYRWTWCALTLLAGLAVSPAMAGPVADKASEAERLLAEGKAADGFAALDSAVDAFWAEAPLTLVRVSLIGADGSAQENPVRSGDPIRILIEPKGYASRQESSSHIVSIAPTVEIRKGDIVFAKSENLGELSLTSDQPVRSFTGRIGVTLPELQAGTYDIVLTLTDVVSGKTAMATLPISVE